MEVLLSGEKLENITVDKRLSKENAVAATDIAVLPTDKTVMPVWNWTLEGSDSSQDI